MGTWVGTIVEDETGISRYFVMYIEQVGERVSGVLSLPSVEPDEGFLPFAEEYEVCNLSDGVFADGGLTFRFVTGEAADLIFSGGYDAATEVLVGEWRADTSLKDYRGTFQVTRISWETGREVDGVVDYLGCSGLPPSPCRDELDNDGDGLVDDEDPGCGYVLVGADETQEPRCQDSLDNDGDGLVDEDDPECPGWELGSEPACSDGWDNDGDGLVDLDDPACAGNPRSRREVPEMCEDLLDNDGDGLVDAEDPQCADHHSEDPSAPACSDGYDNDGDGLVDLEDPLCQGLSTGQSETAWSTCDDGLDNDLDGLIDGDEPGCSAMFLTDEEGQALLDPDAAECDDGIDNDGDGLVDLEDTECTWIFFGTEVAPHPSLGDSYSQGPNQCDDSIDNDGDGLVDMDDPACSFLRLSSGWSGVGLGVAALRGATRGFESSPPCLDGQDNDGDGFIDREDPDCVDPYAVSEAPECSNGIDDDDDGLIDTEDPTCGVPPGDRERRPQCDDGQDNDEDGLSDAEDPDCFAPHDDREIAACSDGLDNDGDGFFDLADDGCADDPDRDDER